MGIIRMKSEVKQPKLDVRQIQRAISRKMGYEYIFNNVYYDLGTEADCLLVSAARYLTEIEIKTSFDDFKADSCKWKNGNKKGFEVIKYFYYCMPLELAEKCFEHVRKDLGVLGVYWNERGGYYDLKVLRSSGKLQGGRCSAALLVKLFRNNYYKHREFLYLYNMHLDEKQI